MSTVVVVNDEPIVVVVPTPTTASVTQTSSGVTVSESTSTVTVSETPTDVTPHCDESGDVIEVNTPGPQGPPGTTDAAVINATSGAAISALRVVKFENDLLYRADSATPSDAGKVVGISVTAASGAAESIVVRTDGEMSDASWSWVPGPIYCGGNGALTQTPPVAGFVLEVARARSATKIIVDIQIPFLRN